MKQKEKAEKTSEQKDRPLFTGDYMHDSSVSGYETVAEVAKAITSAIKKERLKSKVSMVL